MLRFLTNKDRLRLQSVGVCALWAFAFIFSGFGTPAGLLAQDAVMEEEEEEPRQAQIQHQFQIDESWFDQWLFNGSNATQRKKRLEARITLHVSAVDAVCSLTDAQKQKLELAGRGDIKQLFDAIETARVQFQAVRNDQQKFNAFWPEVQPLQVRLQAGQFGKGSLFEKVLARTLDAEQSARFEKQQLERRKFQYEARIGVVLTSLEKGMPLRDEQRQKLSKLIVEETQPPKVFGQYDYYVVMYQLAKLPKEKLEAILDEKQLGLMRQQLNQMQGMEQFLKQQGQLP